MWRLHILLHVKRGAHSVRRFPFLKKLELFDNPVCVLKKLFKYEVENPTTGESSKVAEEPDYRPPDLPCAPGAPGGEKVAAVGFCRQVELLDQHTVKLPERLRADEVVPNLDKASHVGQRALFQLNSGVRKVSAS